MPPTSKITEERSYSILSASLLKEVLLHVQVRQFEAATRLVGDWLLTVDFDLFKQIAVLHPIIATSIDSLEILEKEAVLPPKEILNVWKIFERGMKQLIQGCEKFDKSLLLDGCLELAKIDMLMHALQTKSMFLSIALDEKPEAVSDLRRKIERNLMDRLGKAEKE